MQLLTLNRVAVLGAFAVLAGCSGSSGGNTTSSSSSSSSGGHASSSGSTSSSSSGGTSSSSSSGASSSSSGGNEGGPSIFITSPSNGSTVTPTEADGGGEEDILVSFSLGDFTLMAPGSCGSTPNCGHIHLLIDGANSCGGPPYNNAITSGTSGNAIISKCSQVNGSHVISLELHDDQHNPINGPNGQVISSSVTITVQGG